VTAGVAAVTADVAAVTADVAAVTADVAATGDVATSPVASADAIVERRRALKTYAGWGACEPEGGP
jgi:hypothetical protein